MTTSAEPRLLTLAGRRFRVLGEVTTLEHEEYLGELLGRAGIKETLVRPGEDLADYEVRVVERLLTSKLLRPLAACLIVPESAVRPKAKGLWPRLLRALRLIPAAPLPPGGGWTPAVATDTEAFLGELDDPADKQQVYGLVEKYLLPFWTRALASWAASLRSSTQAVQDLAAAGAPAIPAIPTAPGEP
jgi:hypothetical protein